MSVRDLLNRISDRSAVVAVIGLGYVGLPTVRAMHDAGFSVIGFDIDQGKIEKLRRGEMYLAHLGQELYRALAASDRFEPTSDPKRLGAADAILICVPTPLGEAREPDLTYVERSTRMIAEVLKPRALVILVSTTWPGTTREICKPILDAAGRPYLLAFSPEREDPGRPGLTTSTIPRLVGGVDEAGGDAAEALLRAAIRQVHRVASAEIAEAAKLLENIYRAVNIALVNELKPVLAAMGIDIWRVIEAAATKPFGFQAFYPGPGLGGHCIPIDPFYLSWIARRHGMPTRFIELAGEINSRMPHQVVEAVALALNDEGKPVKGSTVLVIGVAYKPNIDDIREAPAAEIITRLLELGADVSYHDPHVPVFPRMRRYEIDLRSQPLTREALASADCVLIVTNHAAIDYALIGREASLIVDTRDAMHGVEGVRARVVPA